MVGRDESDHVISASCRGEYALVCVGCEVMIDILGIQRPYHRYCGIILAYFQRQGYVLIGCNREYAAECKHTSVSETLTAREYILPCLKLSTGAENVCAHVASSGNSS